MNRWMRSSQATILRRMRLGILACSVMIISGCHQGVIYHASSLPPELTAPRVGNLNNVDLSRLARTSGDSEVLYPGDVLDVSIVTGLEKGNPTRWKLRIAEDGTINVPLVGPVHVAGNVLTDAERIVHAESIRRGKFVNPNVSVLLAQRRTHRVTVVGAVNKPGTYELSASSSFLLQALNAAEGLSEDAYTLVEIQQPPGRVQTARPAFPPGDPRARQAAYQQNQATPARTVTVDLEQPAPDQDYFLDDGSTVMVMKKPKRFIHVMGLVNNADQFEMPDDQELHLLDALAMAGGRRLELADKVHVIRKDAAGGEPVVIEASVKDAKRDQTSNIRLQAGDVVSVEETATTFAIETLRSFVRFGFSSGIPGL